MAEATIVVPTQEARLTTRRNWTADISNVLDAGNDAKFVDEEGNQSHINFINCTLDATIYLRGPDEDDTKQKPHRYVSGGWHKVIIGKIFAGGTTASIYLLGKLEL